MANEATVTCSLQIRKGAIEYQSRPTSFQTDVDATFGPTPGAMAVATTGTDVDLSRLTVPGLCKIANLDTTNFIEYGIWDPEAAKFYPLGEIRPGEFYVLRLSRNLFDEFAGGPGTGTGTTGPATNTLRLRADNADCNAVVEAFEA